MPAANPVLAALAQARARAAPMFARWCELNGAPFCPARPADVARFVSDCASLGIGRVWPAVQEISRLHATLGLADPTLGIPVAAAVSDIAGVDPPRSWPDGHKQRFRTLAYDMQVMVALHDKRREKALRRAQNEAAAVRRKVAPSEPLHPQTIKENHANEADSRSHARAADQASA